MKILCVGNDPKLLHTRCEVLTKAGYDCQFAFPQDVEGLLKEKRFDLCILSALVSKREKIDVIALIGDSMPVIKLETLVMAPELLTIVQAFVDAV